MGRIAAIIRAIIIVALAGYILFYLWTDLELGAALLANLHAVDDPDWADLLTAIRADLQTAFVMFLMLSALCLWAGIERIRAGASAPYAWLMVSLVGLCTVLGSLAFLPSLFSAAPGGLIAVLAGAGESYLLTADMALIIGASAYAIVWTGANAITHLREPAPPKASKNKLHRWRDDDDNPPLTRPSPRGQIIWGGLSCASFFVFAGLNELAYREQDPEGLASIVGGLSIVFVVAFYYTAVGCFLSRVLRGLRFLREEGGLLVGGFPSTLGYFFFPVLNLFVPWRRFARNRNTLAHYAETGEFEITENRFSGIVFVALLYVISSILIAVLPVPGDDSYSYDRSYLYEHLVAAGIWSLSFAASAFWLVSYCRWLDRAEQRLLSGSPQETAS